MSMNIRKKLLSETWYITLIHTGCQVIFRECLISAYNSYLTVTTFNPAYVEPQVIPDNLISV